MSGSDDCYLMATMAHTVVLYTRDGCCLCDRAREVLRRLQTDFELEIEEVEISQDPTLEARYGQVIPVVIIDGRHKFESKIAEHYLRRALSAPRRWPWQR